MSLLESLIAQGMKNNADFTKELIEIKKKAENTKEKQALAALQNSQTMMQDVDDFTLNETINAQEDRQMMKEVDDFTLQQVTEHDSRIAALEAKVNGGTL